jgi:prepilin-type N-terminal cleavage/methylation domain-containing protein
MRHQQEQGFSLIELIIVIAVIGILAGATTPNLKQWTRMYHVKNAAMDLFSNIQMAKMSAIRDNRPWSIDFEPEGFTGYQIRNAAGTVVKEVKFHHDYKSDVEYKDPTSSAKLSLSNSGEVLTLNQSGLTPITGYIPLANSNHTSYYRIAIPYITGAVRLQKWNGSSWE